MIARMLKRHLTDRYWNVGRREFITLLGGATAWPLAARGQQAGKLPLVGLLGGASPSPFFETAFLQGLREAGYVERQNVLIEYRWARGAYERLPALAAEFVALRVDVIATFGTPAAHAAKSASLKVSPPIPVVFAMGSDPVAEGLVASLHRPGGNMTGVTSITGALAPKRLELMREFLRDDAALAILFNPGNPIGEAERRDAEAASRAIGQRLEFLTARNVSEIDAAFATLRERRIAALIISSDTLFFSQMQRLAALAAQYRLPAIGSLREFAAEGGLLSYGASVFDNNRLAGIVAGKVLNGARPADLPVQRAARFELIVNLKTAKAFGIELSPKLLALADEVIE
jgi:putative ABC transport system substrate-binding protein